MSRSSPSSPPSQGPARTYRSPHRWTPYDSDRHSGHRRSSENVPPSPMGPGQQGGDFSGQYMPYAGSSGSFDRTPFSTLQNHGHEGRLPALTTIVNVDELSTEYGLNSAQRKAAHAFCKSGEDRAILMYLRLLRTEQQNNEIQEQLQALQTQLTAVGEFCTEAWKPSKEQSKLLKSLVRHYIIRPITSYTNLVSIVETYIFDHAKTLRLELYKKDPTAKTVVRELLIAENNAVRSGVRKAVFSSVEEKATLMSFSTKMITSHHLPTVPTVPPQDIMACLALMRQVARPLIGKETSRGGDTGFWSNIERELDKLFEKNGNERDSPEWRKWEKEIINHDNSKYNRRAAESDARTQAEIDAAVLASDDAAPGASGVVAPGASEVDDESTHEDRTVNMTALGDLASLDSTPVVRA
ncbi:hypothetical protein FB451DRAFT_1403326 [Mycena latifolia]|nr:hypothetical protein FB451DRAFT_1403326 [Mycena latifolia]